ncbi:5'-adenylylsulfate reductase-like 5 [Gossypium arboreum]|uniref:5'-adenylylsulfate reductase-like 5 n=1 Tax=Gossypium arboreum TaxID=29729 RepID=A0A0B0PGN3_GOSAR|nr:5'-adenylylsulfate reductase-like 5 [Gossypium arboreum]
MGSCSFLLLLFYITATCSIRCVLGSPICSHEADVFIENLRFQCSTSLSPIPPLEVDGNFLDRALTSKQRNGHVSVLLYGSWCPFSRRLRPKFDFIGSMFPQLEHLAVEESSASPRTSSSFMKNLRAGFEPFQYVAEHKLVTSGDHNNHMKQSWNEPFSMEIVKREPYLVFSILFLCMKLLLSIFPIVLSRLETFWVSYAPHLNLEIFGETNQLFARALHMVDVRRVWTKLRLCKTRNFHQGAESARVWASSLASVSLGKSSSGRSSSSP